MKTYLTSFIVSFFFVAATTPLLIKIGIKYGFVDKINRRTIHHGIIPRIGGIGIALGTMFPLFLLLFYKNEVSQTLFGSWSNIFVIVFGGIAISLVGLYDDIRGMNAKIKLSFQIAIAVMAWYFGFEISTITFPFGKIDFGWMGVAVTIIWIVGIINAFNLIDGMDGLSSGVSFFACITIMALSIANGTMFVALVSAALAGAVVGFLIYNFNPAKIFMGDSGSMFIGYLLAVLALKSQSKGHTLVSLLVPIIAMGIPILDTILAFIRRYLRNQSIFAADRQHIHHILLSKGWNQKKVVLVLYGITILFTLLAMLLIFNKDAESFLVITVFSIIVGVIITKLGYLDILYSKFKTGKGEKLENLLEIFFLEKLSKSDAIETISSSLPIKGFEIIDNDGNSVILSGERDKINFIDIAVENRTCVRLFWNTRIPTINTKESTMLLILAKFINQEISRRNTDLSS